ncbi:hypothetical protein HYPSUDRAFT_38938 [Hypholoma sublateritium FD-334 SS-4]|uniref:Uncharacterized protein n=1 Tax=Hypholoma sublateritium (strain FD-334 SS-4) TaxID=945553 RepID=A0A0D2P699_HYPSF|nr:hypothetical protein HYPSUDRAFT_38938 [Hypholoma sublateritium FD-334 SS-4]
MSDPGNNSVSGNGNPRGPPNVDLRALVNALMRQVQAEFALTYGGAISQQLLRQIASIVRANLAPLSALLTTAGLAMLLPSLAVVIVNAVGFTSGGVFFGGRVGVREPRGGYSVALLRRADRGPLLVPPGIRSDGGNCGARGVGAGWYIAGNRSRPLWLVAVQEMAAGQGRGK